MLAPTKALSKWRASGCFICQGYGGLLARGARAAERDTLQRLEKGYYDDNIDDLDLMALQRLQDRTRTCQKELSELASLIGGLIPRGRGRRRGVERYPGLSELVFWLEIYAQDSGGTFTAHRKLCDAKGSLVQALDRLRDRFLSSSDLKYLADLIPARGKHPIAAYERTLKAAREAVHA
jgi:hypothetical protein